MAIKIGDEWVSVFFTGCKIKVGGSFFLQFVKKADGELLEHIAQEAKLSQKTVAYFDKRYPGYLKEFAAFLFAKKSFIKSDYNRHLCNVVISLAGLEPTIFVGRGTHLILPF